MRNNGSEVRHGSEAAAGDQRPRQWQNSYDYTLFLYNRSQLYIKDNIYSLVFIDFRKIYIFYEKIIV